MQIGAAMKQTPIHMIVSQLKPLALHHQIAHLRALIASEKLHSVRRNELESLLRGKMARQLRRECRESAA